MKTLKLFLFLFILTNASVINAYDKIHSFRINIVYVEHEKDLPINIEYNSPKYLGQTERTGPGTCTIWVKKPDNVYDRKRMELIGHQIVHCTDGNYHGTP